VNWILARAAQETHGDLEAWETALRAAVLVAGARALSGLLQGIGSGRRDARVVCECGGRMESRGLKQKELLTMLGPVTYERSMFECPDCHRTRYPGDEQLDIEGTTRSPGLRRMMARAGSKSTFREGHEDLKVYAGIEVSPKDVERVAEAIGQDMQEWLNREREEVLQRPVTMKMSKQVPVMYISCDGTGVPMVRGELRGRKGKQADGTAKTREAKLGCVFTQTTTDREGRPVRDPDSTTFVGAIESAEEFGERIYPEAVRRGVYDAASVVVLGDGAEWIWKLCEMHFPQAIQIMDLYHVREHVAKLCRLLFGYGQKTTEQRRERWWRDLDAGQVEKIIREAKAALAESVADRSDELIKDIENEIGYLERNKHRMRYAHFRAQGLFVGSGVVEAGCKTVIGQRLKQSGMEWSVRGANAIITLRCIMQSARLEDYWESRAG
jgi:hypothetical protein